MLEPGENSKQLSNSSIAEVWFWEDGTLSLYLLRMLSGSAAYEQISRSELMPGLDIAVLLRCINMSNHVEAVREFRSVIRES